MRTCLFALAISGLMCGCGQKTKIGTGTPGEFSREAVQKAAMLDSAPVPAKEEENLPKRSSGRIAKPDAGGAPAKKK